MRVLLRFGVLAAVAVFLIVGVTSAQSVIVPSPFVSTAYDSWTDTFEGFDPYIGTEAAIRTFPPQWGIILGDDPQLLEDSDGFIGGTEAEGLGSFRTLNLINNSAAGALPTTYALSGTFNAYDNDGLGLIFGYQDENNFFRVSSRPSGVNAQYAPTGIGIQKCVNGVYTSIAYDDTQLTPVDGTDFTLSVAVNNGSYDVSYNGSSVLSGTDADLTSGGDYGVFSWGQTGYDRGTQVRNVTLASSTINNTHTFTDTGDVAWKDYAMYNSVGETLAYTNNSDFRLDFRDDTIRQDANNYTWATTTAPNTDFLSPAVVVDDANASTWTDYEVWARFANDDDDGIGLMVRVQEDSFYRINFCKQAIGDTEIRAPQGMSIQKCTGYMYWSELYRDDQENPLFTYTPRVVDTETDVVTDAVPFDVKVTVENTLEGYAAITVEIIDDPDGAATVITYPTVYDEVSPITSGGVGLTAWGSGAIYPPGYPPMESVYSGYGGNEDMPLVTEIGYVPPEDDIPGDANRDGKVDGSDVTILANNWQAGVPGGDTSVTWAMGDFNGDHMVDGSDVTILANNWQYGVTTSAATVPEPSTIVLLLLGTVVLLLRKVK